jgi:16S rRNA A1518/A1519 N6-dimethyltransferase RsmA/KsgA/DIM1 with predicted DNA glycosylase/AP lyase activity
MPQRVASIPPVAVLPKLRCPGGPRLSSHGIRQLFNAPNSRTLANNDQRFILNLKLTHQIMVHLSKSSAPSKEKLFLELGPGAGALTRSILTRPSAGVLGVELDKRFNPLLQQIHLETKGKFQWVNGDVLKCDEYEMIQKMFPLFAAQHERLRPADFDKAAPLASAERIRDKQQQGHSGVADRWWSDGGAMVEVIANLPFSVISRLLVRYAVDCDTRQGVFRFGRVPLHVFAQKEVAERMTATPGTGQFSMLSVLLQNYFKVHVRQTFREKTYYPETEVLGAFLTLEPRPVPLVGVAASSLVAFLSLAMQPHSRGITIFKALRRFLPEEVAGYMLQELRLDGSLMPLQLSVAEVAGMAMLWQRFLEATNQEAPHKAGPQTPSRSHIDKERAEEEHDYERSDFERRMWQMQQDGSGNSGRSSSQ